MTEAGGHRFRTRGRRLVEAGWRAAAFGEEAAAEEPAAGDDDEPRQSLPKVEEGESGTCEKAEVLEKQTKPPPRYSEASLLKDMETAGKQIEDEELRDAMKEAGLGTPATRAETIEKLIRVELHRAAREAAPGDVEGPAGDRAPRRPRAHVGRAHRIVGEAPLRHRARRRRARRLHARHPRLHLADRRVLPRALLRRRARAPRRDRPVPQLRRHHPREPAAPTAARRGRAARSPAAASSSGSSRRAARSRPPRRASCSRRARPSSSTGSRPGRAGRGSCSPRETRCSSSPTTAPASTLPAGPREKIADCPKCDGEIRENSRAYGCSSWKSKKETGCGFVIWKSTKGRQISIDEARQVIEKGASDWMDFKDRKGPFRGRLVLTPEQTVEVQREDEGTEAATQAA